MWEGQKWEWGNVIGYLCVIYIYINARIHMFKKGGRWTFFGLRFDIEIETYFYGHTKSID